MARYDSNADTGHKMLPVRPRWMVTPRPKTSVLLCRSVKCTIDGFSLLSIATSESDRTAGSGDALDLQVNSAERRKPKKAVQHAAHRHTVS